MFARMGESYAIYLPQATGTETLNTGRVDGRFGQCWFEPRTGQVTNGSQQLSASDALPLGGPPYATGDDWVVLISRLDQPAEQSPASQIDNEAPRFNSLSERTVTVGEQVFITLTATDSDGTFPSVTVGTLPGGMRINGPGNGQLELSWTVPENAAAESVVELIAIDARNSSLRSKQHLVLQVRGGNADVAEQDHSDNAHTPDVAPSHSPPVFVPISSRQVRAGSVVSLRVEAKDADGVPPALIAVDAPAGASYGDNGDGTRTLVWQTRQGEEGLHAITFLARDHALPDVTTTLRVEIQITP